jgi:hypothetical protein
MVMQDDPEIEYSPLCGNVTCEGTVREPADDFRHHHEVAECDHYPGASLVLLVAFATRDMWV